MRVISGKYKGKKLEGFNISGTRPTMDRVKESLFASISSYLEDSVCLDLFAGSGALGIEALSNGASKCYFVDNSKEILPLLKKNIEHIKNSILIHGDYLEVLKNLKEKIDIIFLDPPYQSNLIQKALNVILENNLLSDKGIIICEYEQEVFNCPLEILKEKKYGDKFIRIYKKNEF